MDEDPLGFEGFVDDRPQQGTLDVGIEANVTRGRQERESAVAGSAGFEDIGLDDGMDAGEQTGLVEMDESVGGGQTDLFGGEATETVGGEWASDDVGFESSDAEVGGLAQMEANIEAASAAGVIDPVSPNGDEEHAPRDLFPRHSRPLPDAERDRAADLTRAAAARDVSLAPDEAYRDVGLETREVNGRKRGVDVAEPPEIREQEASIIAGALDEAAGIEQFGPTRDDMVSTPSTLGETAEQQRVEFGSIDDAREFRDLQPDVLAESDVPQAKTVTLDVGAADADTLQQAEERALISFADERAEAAEMEPLSEGEIENLRVSHDTFEWQQHGFQAMRAKAALQSRGAAGSDWLDYYDPGEDWTSSLEKLEEGKQRAARGGGRTALEHGMRMDSPDDDLSRGEIARRIEAARGRGERHAIEGAREGHEEALDALQTDFGWSPAETERLQAMVDDPATPFTSADIKRIESFERSQTSGRMVAVPTQRTSVPPGRRSPPSGQFAPPPQRREPPGIVRARRTGRFKRDPQ